MAWFTCSVFLALACSYTATSQAVLRARDLPSVSLSILATTPNVESDKVFFSYGRKPLFIGNDGSADLGGVHVFDITKSGNKIPELYSKVTGRTKVVSAVYSVDEEDYIVTFSTPEHLLRFYELPSGKEVKSSTKFILAEFSALCSWMSPETNAVYIYLFGKKEVHQYLLKEGKDGFEAVKVVSFVLPIEAETCASALGESIILFGGSDKKVYTFPASDYPTTPKITTRVETEEEITGSAVYHSSDKEYYYLVAFEEYITVYSKDFKAVGTINLDIEGLELSDIAIYQGELSSAKEGLIGYAFESDDYGKGFGTSSLTPFFTALKIKKNTKWDPIPKKPEIKFPKCKVVLKDCNNGGICSDDKKECVCYSGFSGNSCEKITCPNNCTGVKNGKCVAADVCQCKDFFTGPDCSTIVVNAKYETEASGADGDDPAVWVAPTPSASKIITTTKSEDNPGLSVFDLKGQKLQFLAASEPNNVDVIYNFPISSTQTIDLAYAGCRGDNTLCLFQISPLGLLSPISGGSQPTPEDFDIYGTCVFHRRSDNKVFLFANSKEATYLQYELTSSNNTLVTTLVRTFQIGTGTQPEGCVVDDINEVIFIGEEQVGLWKYGANPTDPGTGAGVLVDQIRTNGNGLGKIDADVEGMALVYGKSAGEGYIIVSMQGVSAYNVYKREAPHAFVRRVAILKGNNGVDGVTNTDGVAAVGTGFGGVFGEGVLVVHDDANEKAEGGTDVNASFKLVSLGDVLKGLEGVDHAWDPRK